MAIDLNPFTPPPRAFISYARTDGEATASSLRSRLELEHPEMTLWLDRAQMVAGVGWWKQITEALDQVETLIMVMTPAATRSEVAAKEWRYARQQGVRVCPVFLPDSMPDFDTLPGWMCKAHFYNLDKEWETFIAFLQSASQVDRIPFMAPDLPDNFVDRPEQFSAIIEELLDETGENPRATTAALQGAGGFGKTTFAIKICHSEKIMTAFDDGILWVRLGETPNIQGELTKLYAALTGERPAFVDIDDASIQLAGRLDHKNCLLVVDDVWDPNHLGPFLRGGSRCARLVTTRQLDVVTELGTDRTIVDKMTSNQAVAMLTASIEDAPAQFEQLRALAAQLGEWPLLLKLVAAQLRERVSRGDSLDGALSFIGRAMKKKGVVAFDRANPSARHDAVASTVRASLELFSDEDQTRCAQLAIFRNDVVFPLCAAGALWGLDEFDTEELVQRLDGAALLDFDLKTGGIRLHNVLRSFLESQIDHPESLHLHLVEEWLVQPHDLPDAYAWTWIGWHLVQACQEERLRHLLLDFEWLKARLKAVPVQATLHDFELLDGLGEMGVVRDAIRLASRGLSFDPEQLRVQVLGRIDRGRSAAIDDLLASADSSESGYGLSLMSATLTHPGGALTGILKSHGGGVHALAVSGDGRWVIAGSDDWTLRLWDLQSNRVIRTYEGHKGAVHSVVFTPDGGSFLSGSEDRTLRLWDVESGQVLQVYRGHTLAVQGVAVTGDGKTATTVSEDGSVRIWDLASKRTEVLFKGRDHQLSAVAISRAGDRLIFGAGDWTLRTMDLHDGSSSVLEGHTGIVRSIALSPDDLTLVSGADDGAVRIWTLPELRSIYELKGHAGSVDSIAVTADGSRIISGSRDKTLRVWDIGSGRELRVLEGHSGFIRSIAVSSTTDQVISGSTDKTIRQWDINAQSGQSRLAAHGSAVSLLSISADGCRAVSGEQVDSLKVWSLDIKDTVEPGASNGSNTAHHVVAGNLDGHTNRVQALQIEAGGSLAFTGSRDRTLRSWDLAECTSVTSFEGHAREILDLDVSSDGSKLLSLSRDRSIRAWDASSGKCLRVLVSRDNRATLASLQSKNALLAELDIGPQVDIVDRRIPRDTSIAISPDGARAVIGHQGYVHAWNLLDGSVTDQELPDIDILSITFVPSSDRVVMGTLFGQVLVWDLASSPRQLEGHSGRILDCAVTTDGNRIVTAARDDSIRFWDSAALVQTGQVTGQTGRVDAVAIAPDGDFAFSVYGETVVAYDLARSTRLGSLSFDHQITTISVTPTGDRIAIGDLSGQVHFVERLE